MSEPNFRRLLIEATMRSMGCTEEEAIVIVDRVADRLAGHTHDEAVEMHPYPRRADSSSGATT